MKIISPATKKFVEAAFDTQKLLKFVGAEVRKIEHGAIDLYLPKSELVLQQHGFIHGGVLTMASDTASGLSAYTLLEDHSHSCITV